MSLMISIGSDTGVIMFAHNFALVPLCSLDKCSTSGKCCLDSVVGDAFENPGHGQVLISYCGLAPTQNGPTRHDSLRDFIEGHKETAMRQREEKTTMASWIAKRQQLRKLQKMMTKLSLQQQKMQKLKIPMPAEVRREIEKQTALL